MATVNLQPYSSMETGAGLPTGSVGCTVAFNTAQARQGTRSLKMTATGTATAYTDFTSAGMANVLAVSTQYTVSAYAYSATATNIRLTSDLFSGGGVTFTRNVNTATTALPAGAWLRISLTFTTSATEDNAVLQPEIVTPSGAGVAVWWDQFQIETGAVATAWVPGTGDPAGSGALAAPGNLHTTAIASTSISLAWDAVTGASGYELNVSPTTAPSGLSYLRGVASAGNGTMAGRYTPATSTYDTDASFAFYASRGHKIIRIPFLWEHLQPTLLGALDSTELSKLTAAVNSTTSRGMMALLDMHNYARYEDAASVIHVLGDGSLTNAHFADVWSRLANSFKANPAVWLGLMNEPHDIPGNAATWESASSAAVSAIRATGATNTIGVSGYQWSSAPYWWTQHSTAWIADANVVYEAHFYLDIDGSSNYVDTYAVTNTNAVSQGYANLPARIAANLKSFTDGCAARGVKGMISEIGWPNNAGADLSSWNTAANAGLNVLDTAKCHVTFWAAGEAWVNDNYKCWIYGGVPQSTLLGTAATMEAHPSG